MAKEYKGPERRKNARADANFVVSYRIKEPEEDYDLSQTRNLSQGGILITTNQYFEKGLHLEMTIRFPFVSQKIQVIGEVTNCREAVPNIIYETRIKFLNLNMDLIEKIGGHVKRLLGR